MLEIFTEFMDLQLFYEGFTADLIANDPVRFQFEFAEFEKLYA